MTAEPIVGLDVGTTGVKALALSAGGDVLARAEEPYPLSRPATGWTEQDPEDWWRAAEAALRRLGIVQPAAIGLSGQMHGLVLLDDRLRVLRPAILWNDQRTTAECAEIEERLGLDRLIRLTANRALPGFTAPKLLWVRRHEPDVYARAAHVLLPKDYVRLRLTGELATDVADASGTLLFDVARRTWSDEMLTALELPRAWLPEVLESAAVSGRGPGGVPVAVGAGDQAAAALGVGVDRPGRLSLVLGTSGVLFAVLPSFQADSQARVHAFCHAVPGTWHAMGVILAAAGSLRWFREALAPAASFEQLADEAASSPPGAAGITFLPYLSGERTPHADPDARGAFLGLAAEHGRPDLVRAVLEGVAFGLRDALELLLELGVRPQVARASGGGSRSRLWLRIVASALGLAVERMESEEGSAYGAALLGGIASGVFRDAGEAVSSCVRVVERVEPEAEWIEAYEVAYRRFRALYPALRGVTP